MRRLKRSAKPLGNRLPLFARISLFFFDRPRFSIGLWLLIFVFGIASYTTLLKREGFPDVSIPYSFINGAYLVDDAAKVDADIGKPVSDVVRKVDGVTMVDAQSSDNFYTIVIQYEEDLDSSVGNAAVEAAVKKADVLPAETIVEFKPLSPEINDRGDDMLVALYKDGSPAAITELAEKGRRAAKFLADSQVAPSIGLAELIDPFVKGVNPATGQEEISQKTFDRFGFREGNQTKFYESVEIGIQGVKGFDVLELDEQVEEALIELNSSGEFEGYSAKVSFSLAPSIKMQVNDLQQSLLEGLLAVLVVSAILIAFRAAFITVSAMVMVIMATLGLLFAIGYSLNTITLFSLILCLSLIVDDTIIMVEAIDAQRRKVKRARDAVELASKKISRVMVAATLTATIGFAPLIFVGGILGGFIRAIPITVVLALFVSLVVALTFIPVLSRYLILRPHQLGIGNKNESPAHHLERFIASFLARPILWMQHSRKRQFTLGLTAVFAGLVFIGAGGFMFQKVPFNIFAPSRDSDQLGAQLVFEPGLDIADAQEVADRANQIIARETGSNFRQASYYNTGAAQGAIITMDLTSFKQREVTAPELEDQLEAAFKSFPGATIQFNLIDVGPPAAAFTVRIETNSKESGFALAADLRDFLEQVKLKRLDGSTARLKSVTVSSPDVLTRRDSRNYISVTAAEFDGTDTSALVTLAEDAVNEEFDKDKLADYGLKPGVIKTDLGIEGDFQDSFNTMLFAFPLLLVAIYILLTIQFRSLLQPALIFMAIPFSLFGITGGLWLTDNAFSFFTMLGFFALLGLSIKNTILLTDYANRARRDGHTAIESVAISLQERFRPLVATSLTAVVSLIPLYLANPFWEGLTVTLIFGLLSSTFLVITVFPYYYLGAEYLRLKIRRRIFALWLLISGGLSATLALTGASQLIPFAILLVTLAMIGFFKSRR